MLKGWTYRSIHLCRYGKETSSKHWKRTKLWPIMFAHIIWQAPFQGCGSESVSVVYGDVNSKYVAVENLLTWSKKEVNDGKNTNYWMARKLGTFILNLGCVQNFEEIQLVNFHNGDARNRSTKRFRHQNYKLINWDVLNNFDLFRIYVGESETGPWKLVLDQGLPDSRKEKDPLPLQIFSLTERSSAQFLKFDCYEYRGYSCGLQYFDIIRIRN